MSSYFDLTNKVAMVTGASSGLGERFAMVLAKQGAQVVVAARRKKKLSSLVEKINATGGKAIAVPMDVTSVESVVDAFDVSENEFGIVDILINNAGVAQSRNFLNVDEENWDFIIDTNLTGVWRVASEATKRLVSDNKPGSIVNVASILGLAQGRGESVYATSKAAVVQLTKSMALDLASKNIRVNALCPGYFETEMNQAYFASDAGKEYVKTMLTKRVGNIPELDAPLLLLASDAGSFVNGVALPVDGGHLVSSL